MTEQPHQNQQSGSPGASSDGDRSQTLEDRSFLDKGSSGSTADAAPADRPTERDRDENAPHARRAEESDKGKHDQLAKRAEHTEDRQEALIDEGVEETFPASDPVSVKRIT